MVVAKLVIIQFYLANLFLDALKTKNSLTFALISDVMMLLAVVCSYGGNVGFVFCAVPA